MSDVTVQVGDVIHVSVEDVAQKSVLIADDPPQQTVLGLLTESRAAHLRFHQNSGTIHKDGTLKTSPDYQQAADAIRAALSAREQAELLDPTHADPAWQSDRDANRGVTSDALLGFYRDYLL